MGAGSDLKQETQPSKKRKVVEKTVVRVRIGAKASGGKLKNEGLPSDFWSWRKYGQKPIKGSPYPRGYYRCSTAKGCSAKKQVEICRTDATMLIITYTSTHNHPGGPEPIQTSDQAGLQNPTLEGLVHEDPEEEEEEEDKKLQQNQSSSPTTMNMGMMSSEEDDKFHYLKSPIRCSQEGMEEEDPFSAHLLGGEPISCSHHELLMTTTTTTSTTEAEHFEGSDLFDELEELMPISPSSSLSYTSFVKMSSISFDERIPVVPFLN